jgi:DNA-binding beta-propeller fold protein YncE
MKALLSLLLLAAPAAPEPSSFPFPGKGDAWTDYVAFDPASQRVWVPAGSRGETYAFDVKGHTYQTVAGFPTAAMGKRVAGPSSVAIGPAAVYVGNRADSKVCAVDRATMKIGSCATLKAMPDGIVYVPTTQEVWATTPKDSTLTIISTKGGKLATEGTIAIEGSPEGYAVDGDHGIFYTNDEKGDRTYAIDVKTHKVVATYHPNCGSEGPRGIIYEPKHRFLLVACFDGASVLDLAKEGAVKGHLKTGGGVDNIDFAPATGSLYLASGRTGKLVIAHLGDDGALSQTSEISTSDGIRAVVVDGQGTAYLPDSKGARVLVVAASK